MLAKMQAQPPLRHWRSRRVTRRETGSPCRSRGRSGQVFTVTDTRGNTYRKAVQFNVTADTPNGDTLGIFMPKTSWAARHRHCGRHDQRQHVTLGDTGVFGVALANRWTLSLSRRGPAPPQTVAPWSLTAAGDLLFGAIMTSNAATYTGALGSQWKIACQPPPHKKLMTKIRFRPLQAMLNERVARGHRTSGVQHWRLSRWPLWRGCGRYLESQSIIWPRGLGDHLRINLALPREQAPLHSMVRRIPGDWSATSIVFPVPANATSGNVVVTVVGSLVMESHSL